MHKVKQRNNDVLTTPKLHEKYEAQKISKHNAMQVFCKFLDLKRKMCYFGQLQK